VLAEAPVGATPEGELLKALARVLRSPQGTAPPAA